MFIKLNIINDLQYKSLQGNNQLQLIVPH
uniref:Uncharacterized protein n=1 Tax=Tetranychus urticae TaxID=32264 RepID=T1KT42_TETUR